MGKYKRLRGAFVHIFGLLDLNCAILVSKSLIKTNKSNISLVLLAQIGV